MTPFWTYYCVQKVHSLLMLLHGVVQHQLHIHPVACGCMAERRWCNSSDNQPGEPPSFSKSALRLSQVTLRLISKGSTQDSCKASLRHELWARWLATAHLETLQSRQRGPPLLPRRFSRQSCGYSTFAAHTAGTNSNASTAHCWSERSLHRCLCSASRQRLSASRS